MEKKHILVLASTFPRWKNDTTPPFVFELEKRLVKDFEIHVIAPHYQGAKKEEIMERLHVHRFQYFWPNQWQKLCDASGILPNLKENKLLYIQAVTLIVFELITVIKLCKKNKFDLIHAHWIIPQGLTAYVNYLINKTPYIVTSHGSDLHSLGLNFIKKLILSKAKKITVVGSYLKEEIKKVSPKLLLKTEIIPMGVDIRLFNPNKYDESIKTKYKIDGPFLLFVGRLAPEKGIEYLIGAMPSVLEKHPKAKLLVIGGGTLEEKLKNLVKTLKIEASVVFVGLVKHKSLPPYFATAEIFVSPSIKEGVPATYLEALSSGNYLVVGDIPVSHDLIKDPTIGAFTHPNSQEISRILIKAIKRKKQERNYKAIIRRYSWRVISNKYKKIYLNF